MPGLVLAGVGLWCPHRVALPIPLQRQQGQAFLWNRRRAEARHRHADGCRGVGGAPNKAASGFFSNILREPLVGVEAALPVDDNVRHWFASPKAATGFMLHAARLGGQSIGSRRNLTMPGLSATVAEEIEALRRVAGEKAVKLIRRQPDETIQRIVAGWPSDFIATRAVELGFEADRGFDEIVRIHVDDELGGRIV